MTMKIEHILNKWEAQRIQPVLSGDPAMDDICDWQAAKDLQHLIQEIRQAEDYDETTQRVQFSASPNKGTFDIIQGDCALARKIVSGAIARAASGSEEPKNEREAYELGYRQARQGNMNKQYYIPATPRDEVEQYKIAIEQIKAEATAGIRLQLTRCEEQCDELLAALRATLAILTQRVQFSAAPNKGSFDIIQGDCAAARKIVSGAIAKAEGKT